MKNEKAPGDEEAAVQAVLKEAEKLDAKFGSERTDKLLELIRDFLKHTSTKH